MPKPKKEIFPSQNTLKAYVGTYEISSDYIAQIKLKNDILFLQINNDSEIKLSAETEYVFFVKDENILIEFIDEGNKKQKIKEGLSTKIGDKIEK